MLQYTRCSDDRLPDVYQAFSAGFSDYVIPMQQSYDQFVQRIFGPEGNRPEHSFIAYDDQLPVGLALGGIREYEGVRTMRCGALCVSPDYRRRQVAQALFELHRGEALALGCQQLFLEVIVGNERAINFYCKVGYQSVYDLRYFTCTEPRRLLDRQQPSLQVETVSLAEIKATANPEVHVNWQNSLDYLAGVPGVACYGVRDDQRLLAYLCITPSGRLFQLWVTPRARRRGIASNLLAHAVLQLNLPKLSVGTPNNASLQGFLRQSGFSQDPLAQFEMYLPLARPTSASDDPVAEAQASVVDQDGSR